MEQVQRNLIVGRNLGWFGASDSTIKCTALEQLDSVDPAAATKFLILFGSDILLT